MVVLENCSPRRPRNKKAMIQVYHESTILYRTIEPLIRFVDEHVESDQRSKELQVLPIRSPELVHVRSTGTLYLRTC